MASNIGKLVKLLCILAVSLMCFLTSSAKQDHVASKLRAEKVQAQKCGYDLQRLWHIEVGHSPFAAVPLLADVDADGAMDIVAAPFTETLTVVQAVTGDTLPNSSWPASNFLYSVYATPIQFDVDGDGMLDLLFTTFSAELLFYKYDGMPLPQYTVQIPCTFVKRNWHQSILSVSADEIKDYIWTGQDKPDELAYICIDAHVLATPVLTDINQDDRTEELVIPLSYYLDDEEYRFDSNLTNTGVNKSAEVNNYLVSGVAVVNLTSQQLLWTARFELTQMNGQYPAFVLSSPTVVDLDSSHGDLEVVLATSAGSIHVLSSAGQRRAGFPVTESSIHGQVSVADVTGDGRLELVAYDTGGLVVCVSNQGNKLWEAEVSSASTAGSQVADLDGDGTVDVVLSTSDGKIFALKGTDGTSLPGWPLELHSQVISDILLTRLRPSQGPPDVVVVADGTLHMVAGDQSCRAQLPMGETLLVEAAACDVVPDLQGPELLLAASDGSLVLLGSSLPESQDAPLPCSASSLPFHPSQPRLHVLPATRLLREATGTSFGLHFEILGPAPAQPEVYIVRVFFGRNLLVKERYSSPGTYVLTVPVWHKPAHGHVTVTLTNRHGMVSIDTFPLRFNQLILQDLQWLVIAPFIALIIILLVNHGYPAKDLLPVTFPSKAK